MNKGKENAQIHFYNFILFLLEKSCRFRRLRVRCCETTAETLCKFFLFCFLFFALVLLEKIVVAEFLQISSSSSSLLREKSADSSLLFHVWTTVTGSVYNRKCHGLVQLLHRHLSTVSSSSLIEQVICIISALLWCLSFLIIALLSWSRAVVAVCEFLYVLSKSFEKFSNSRSSLLTSDFIDFPAYSTSSKDLTRVKFVFKPYLCSASLPSCNKFSGSDFLNTLPLVIPEKMHPLRENLDNPLRCF
jgi:hypothetical protein